jgi:hypothetical protein
MTGGFGCVCSFYNMRSAPERSQAGNNMPGSGVEESDEL